MKSLTNKNTSILRLNSTFLRLLLSFLFAFVVFRRFSPFAVPMDEKLEKELVMEFREKT